MSRSNYSDDMNDPWQLILWRGAVKSAISGARGQAFLKEMLRAMDALPEKKLIDHALEEHGQFCAIGAVGKARGVDMTALDPEDSEAVANVFGIADALAREIAYMNDESFYGYSDETPEHRYERMRMWVLSQIKELEG